ncbi:MAG: glutamyl-tRNA reductase [Bacilli bacterium]|nr:glutamyl-tRNA reductase [Bacilli bacterium]
MVFGMMGLNFRTAPVETRECFTLSASSLESYLQQLCSFEGITEAVVVSTCNRTEVYLTAFSKEAIEGSARLFLTQVSGMTNAMISPFLYNYNGSDAINHLFRVACGLDSMVVGETQILGQVRHAHHVAQEAGCTGLLSNQIFRRAITIAKRAHTETDIGEHAVSISYAAVELARKIFEDLSTKTVLIIGAGKMSELTAKHLTSTGIQTVLVVNRTYERARELADKFQGQALELPSLSMALKESDIVISSTGSEGYILTEGTVKAIMKERRQRPLFLIDIAVPRDLDPRINKLDNVYLYDIDDLQGVIAVNLEERLLAAGQVERLIQEALIDFEQWERTQDVIPLISALKDRGSMIQESVMQSLQNKLPGLTERELKILQKHTTSIVSQLLREPVNQMKQLVNDPDAKQYLKVFADIFALDFPSHDGHNGDEDRKPSDSLQVGGHS